jgi:hypothetical protein
VEAYKKYVPASTSAIALNLIKNKFPESIEYKGIADGTRGIVLFFGALMLSCAISADYLFIAGLLNRFSWPRFIITFFALGIGNAVGIYLFLKSFRMELFRPIDEPIIFDRKNRKIYRIFRETQLGWRGLLTSWPLKVAEYDWDLVRAEHHVASNADGAIINRVHALVFLVEKSVNDQTIVDTFTLGSSMQHGEHTVPAVYEHVRKFMEERGPHLPLGETVTNIEKPVSFLQCMAQSGPYGKTLKRWWKNAPLSTILGLLFFPITIPVFTLLGIFSWFSYATSTPIHWPVEVTSAIGKPISDS